MRSFRLIGGAGLAGRRAGAACCAGIWPSMAAAITEDGKPLSLFDGISPLADLRHPAGDAGAVRVPDGAGVVFAGGERRPDRPRIPARARRGATSTCSHGEQRRLTIWQRLASMLSVAFYQERPGLHRARTRA
ncbi:MAG: hypothetical protein MZW92_23330 [Comamonadaceae bacterium]|nr:hypothetical protein [Comamonadaceae bacterium]